MVVNQTIKFEDITDEMMLELALSNQLLYDALVTSKFDLLDIERRLDWWSEGYLFANGKHYLPTTTTRGVHCLLTVYGKELFSITYDQELLDSIT